MKGAESWEDIRRFQEILHPTFKAACLACGLLEDDGEWKKCLEEAGSMQTGDEPPHKIHSYTLLFLLFLRFPYIADPPLRTSAPTRPHAIALALTQQLHSLYWTDLAYLMDI